MDALGRLQELLRNTTQPGPDFRRRVAGGDEILGEACKRLEAKFQQGGRCMASDDQISQSLQAFVDHGELRTLREAQQVCFGLSRPVSKGRSSLFEDRRLFLKVLDRDGGVDQWIGAPRAFRRCFRGLSASYFSFDGASLSTSHVARGNWRVLRDYLHERSEKVHVDTRNPDWVDVVDRHSYVFTMQPFGDLPQQALVGDQAVLDELFDALLIDGGSWFRRDLLLAQVRHAAILGDTQFIELLDRVIELVKGSVMIRDEALAVILERYMRCSHPAENRVLRDVAVEWWGNPWLPSNELHWGRVTDDTRNSVAQWLQKEFIKAFFGKLATDTLDDRRRAQFWLRYVGVFTDMKFGLGRRTLYSQDPDFKELISKMKGLYGPIDSPAVGGDAFIMTLGVLVVVEFSSYSNAMYGYDARHELPFVIDADSDLRTAVGDLNSLKQNSPISALRLMHQDNVLGFATWEERFASVLKTEFGVEPSTANGSPQRPVTRSVTSSASRVDTPTYPEELGALADINNLRIEDYRTKGGNLWVRAGSDDPGISAALQRMGFSYKPGKGWWKGG